MRAIIIAAGQGTRLRPYTADRPKTMVEVAGKPILHHQIDALRSAGVTDIVVIRGYMGRRIDAPGVRFVDNHDFKKNNILESLMKAGTELTGDVIVSYGDIVYHPAVVQALVGQRAPGVVVVDTAWRDTYAGRTDHPVEQAELCKVSAHGLVTEVGKHVDADGAVGEFIGLARFTGPTVTRLWARYLSAKAKGLDTPYGQAPSLRMAYLTDLLNDAVTHGENLHVLGIEGAWREIDTVQDLERAHDAINW